MQYKKTISTSLFIFFIYTKIFSQGNLDTIPLYSVDDDYTRIMQSIFETDYFKNINMNTRVIKYGKEMNALSINDYAITKVIYAKKFEKRFIAICETSSTFLNVLFLGDEKGNISEYPLGDIIMGCYQKRIDDYLLFFIKDYSRSQTRENFSGYFVLSIDMKTFDSKFITFIEWAESPIINFSSPKKVVKDIFISFQESNGKFYIIEKSKENCQEISKFEFYQGNFRKVK